MLENAWLMAQSLGLGMRVISAFATPHVGQAAKELLGAPSSLRLVVGCALGYPDPEDDGSGLRVRRDVEDFASFNRF